MRRGEVWIAAGGGDYNNKPRPVVIVQDNRFDSTESIIVCGLTTFVRDAALFRVPAQPTSETGLTSLSHVMVDKASSVRRTRLSARIGQLDAETMGLVDRALFVFLGLAS